MICILQNEQLQVLQNPRSRQWVSSTARGAKSSNHKILRKFNFFHSHIIFVTYLPREVDGRVLNEIYFLDKN